MGAPLQDPARRVASVADCLRLPVLAQGEIRGGDAGLDGVVRWVATAAQARGCAPAEMRLLARVVDPESVESAARAGAAALAARVVSQDAADAATAQGLPLIALRPDTDLTRVAEDVLDFLIASLDSTLVELTRIGAALGAAATEDLRVSAVAEALSRATGLPVAVHDAELHLIAATNSLGGSNRTAGVRACYTEAARHRGAVRFDADASAGLALPRLVAAVRAGHDLLGFCTVIIPEWSGAGHVAAPALDQAAHLVALAFLHERTTEMSGRLARTALLVDALDERTPAALLEARAHALGIDPAAGCVLIVADAGPEPRPDTVRTALRAGDRDLLLGDLVAGAVVAVIRGDDRDRARAWATDLTRRMGAERAVIGPVAGLTALARRHQEVRAAVDVLRSAGARTVVDVEEMGLVGVLAAGAGHVTLDRFWRRRLAALADHDAGEGSDLCGALTAYLDAGGLRPAARQLGIHPNTLAYRLRRADEIAGLNLDNPDERLELHVALRCRKLLGHGADPSARQ